MRMSFTGVRSGCRTKDIGSRQNKKKYPDEKMQAFAAHALVSCLMSDGPVVSQSAAGLPCPCLLSTIGHPTTQSLPQAVYRAHPRFPKPGRDRARCGASIAFHLQPQIL